MPRPASDDRLWPGSTRGEITSNYFDNECGAGEPYMLIEGPAVVAYNIGNDIVWDMCSYPAIIYLRGSIDFIRNTLWSVSVEACLTTDDDGEAPPGHFRMRDNILSTNGVQLVAGTGSEECRFNNTESPRTPIPVDSIDVACNLLDSCNFSYLGNPCAACGFQGQPMFCELPQLVWNDDPGYWYPVGDFDLHINVASEALPQNRTVPACLDTLGALGVACGDTPVLIENTETGQTISRHNLKIIDTLFESTACLIGSTRKVASPVRRRNIEYIVTALRKAVEGI